jgi:N-acetylglucosamine-6-phosphate deacetylase
MSVVLRGSVHGVRSAEAAVLVQDGHIAWVGTGDPPQPADLELIAQPGELIAPGFIDLQVNGFGGHDAAAGSDAISAISGQLPQSGVTGFIPTMISRPLEEVGAFVMAARNASAPGARVLGAHLEGPFLSPSFHGAHEERFVVTPSPIGVEKILACPPRMMTIAPELPDALDAIARLHAAGVIVAAGHSGADYEHGLRAIQAGVRFGTHLYNAMRDFHHRSPGLVTALLMDPRITVGIIADGLHLHDAVCQQVLQLKGADHVALTTDQTAAAGAPPGPYQLGGRDVISDGRSARLEDGTLAGSVATLDALVRRMAQLPGATLEQAITMAATTPATVLGEAKLGRLQPGCHADIVILDREQRVRLTMVAGRVVFER